MKVLPSCDWCGDAVLRYPSQVKKHNFCCRECQASFSSKLKNPTCYAYRDFSKNSLRFSAMNAELNPTRMNFNTRVKLRESRFGKGGGKTYTKVFGIHEHRIIAERKLGRKLQQGEVVHHIDGNKRNNRPENLQVFSSQAEHAKWHAAQKEAIKNEIHTP